MDFPKLLKLTIGTERGHRGVIQLKVSIQSFKISAIGLHLHHTHRKSEAMTLTTRMKI